MLSYDTPDRPFTTALAVIRDRQGVREEGKYEALTTALFFMERGSVHCSMHTGTRISYCDLTFFWDRNDPDGPDISELAVTVLKLLRRGPISRLS